MGTCNLFAFSGVSANSVSVALRATPGQQVVDLGIPLRWVKVVTVGRGVGAAVDATQAQLCVGWADGTRQSCAWIGETQSANPITGAREIFDAAIAMISPSAAGGSTTFDVAVSVVGMDAGTGLLTLDVSQTDGGDYELVIFALGDATFPPVRLTQLPLEAAYDYAILRPFMKSGGAVWNTPPPRSNPDEG